MVYEVRVSSRRTISKLKYKRKIKFFEKGVVRVLVNLNKQKVLDSSGKRMSYIRP